MKPRMKILIAVLIITGIVFSVFLNIHLQNKFEERFGRKPYNICEGAWSVYAPVDLRECEKLIPKNMRLNLP